MNKTYLIFKHEFLNAIKRTGFIIISLSIPVLALLGIGTGHLVSKITEPSAIEIKTIGYVDEIGTFNINTTSDFVKLISFGNSAEATQALVQHEVSEYFVIPSNYPSTSKILFYTLEKEMETSQFTRAVIKNFLTSNLLTGEVPQDTILLINAPLDIKITRLAETGEVASEQGSLGSFIISGVFALLLSLSLMLNSGYLQQGLGDEKESRLIEVLLSSVSVRQLLTGKVLGLGAAGLVQVFIWLVSIPLLLILAPSSLLPSISSIHILPIFYILGTLYFILGYLFFAVLSIGVGAVSPNAREGQLLALVYTMLIFVPLWFVSLLMFFPKSPLWTVLTLFPITAPVQTMLRLGVVDIPLWEIIASLTVLGLSIILGLSLAIKIFRVHLLMHGKRPGIKQIIRNLKNA